MQAGCLSGLAQILRMSHACEAILRTRLVSTRRRKADNARVRQALHVPSYGCRGSQRLGRRPRSRGGASCSEHSGRGPPQHRGMPSTGSSGYLPSIGGEERHKTSRNEPTKKTKKKLSRKELLRPISERNTGALGSVIPILWTANGTRIGRRGRLEGYQVPALWCRSVCTIRCWSAGCLVAFHRTCHHLQLLIIWSVPHRQHVKSL